MYHGMSIYNGLSLLQNRAHLTYILRRLTTISLGILLLTLNPLLARTTHTIVAPAFSLYGMRFHYSKGPSTYFHGR